MSRIPQRSKLSTVLFNIFINNVDDEAEHILLKFMDNTKVGVIADSLEGHAAIQRELNRLERQADGNFMHFSKEKCSLARGED